jgi:hypothetical protein
MAELMHVQRLVAYLLQLNESDAQLPVELIVNLHRIQLQAPLRNLAASAPPWAYAEELMGQGTGGRQLLTIPAATAEVIGGLNDAYPALQAGKLFENSQELASRHLHSRVNSSRFADRMIESLLPGEEIELTLIRSAATFWHPYEPFLQLYGSTLRTLSQRDCLEMLEIELSLDPSVAQMILAYA